MLWANMQRGSRGKVSGVLALLTISCSSPENAPDPTSIYRAALAEVLSSIEDTVPIALEWVTQSPPDEETHHYFRAIGAPSSLASAHADFNETSIVIDTAVARALGLEYWRPDSLTNPSTMYGVLTRAYNRYKYVVVLSQPVVSRRGKTALVHYWIGCGGLCGNGYVSRLEFVNGSWTVVADSMYVVS